MKLCFSLIALGAATSASAGGPSVHGIEPLPGFDRVRIAGLSADGSFAACHCWSSQNQSLPGRIFRWSSDGVLDLGTPPFGDTISVSTGISGDGSTLVGYSGHIAWKWTETGGFQTFHGTGPAGSSSIAFLALSLDGATAVGYYSGVVVNAVGRYAAYSGTTQALGPLPGLSVLASITNFVSSWNGYVFPGDFEASIAIGVSGDGSTVAGRGVLLERQARPDGSWFYYMNTACAFVQANGVFTILPSLAGESPATVTPVALSADGTTVIGYNNRSSPQRSEGFRWTAAGGVQSLHDGNGPLNVVESSPVGVSANGSTILAAINAVISGPPAWTTGVWTSNDGWFDLEGRLVYWGVPVTPGSLRFPTTVSADGRSFGGNSFNSTYAWVATISCASDLDNGTGSGSPDGGTDVNDLLFFLAAFESGSTDADLDNGSRHGIADGNVDINDLLFFLARFEAGC